MFALTLFILRAFLRSWTKDKRNVFQVGMLPGVALGGGGVTPAFLEGLNKVIKA